MKRAFTWTTFLFLSVFLTAQLYVAQQQPSPAAPPAAATLGLDQKVPVEPAITVGPLPNGLRYYIRANKQPFGSTNGLGSPSLRIFNRAYLSAKP